MRGSRSLKAAVFCLSFATLATAQTPSWYKIAREHDAVTLNPNTTIAGRYGAPPGLCMAVQDPPCKNVGDQVPGGWDDAELNNPSNTVTNIVIENPLWNHDPAPGQAKEFDVKQTDKEQIYMVNGYQVVVPPAPGPTPIPPQPNAIYQQIDTKGAVSSKTNTYYLSDDEVTSLRLLQSAMQFYYEQAANAQNNVIKYQRELLAKYGVDISQPWQIVMDNKVTSTPTQPPPSKYAWPTQNPPVLQPAPTFPPPSPAPTAPPPRKR